MGDDTRSRRMAVLTVAFGMTVAMWAVGYVCRTPLILAPGWVVLPLMLACLLAGGAVLRSVAGGGVAHGAAAGGLSGLLNLLILGSILAGEEPDERVPSALLWVPGSILASVCAVALGALAARRRAGPPPPYESWRSGFTLVSAAAALLVLVAGGLVTSLEVGLAVPDWPSTFGSNMFLYPLSKMTGGIYYEHAHRLAGALVGLTTIVLAGVLWFTEGRTWMKALGALAVAMVVGQGILGGLRVDSSLGAIADPAAAEPSLALAIVHGVLGQIFFVTLCLLLVFSTRTWREAGRTPRESAGSERTLATVLVAFVLLQLVSGAAYRHLYTEDQPMPWPAHVHLLVAFLVAVHAYLSGLRAWGKYAEIPALRRTGLAVVVIISIQLVLGFVALVAVIARSGGPNAFEVTITTLHQANGALLFASAAGLLAWTRRLLGK